ncbi:MAG: methyltransferase domain-containing protein [Chloroflexota bacterium]|nr:methyltransferase domain-containing protein [Chloroflexota bacterium]
MKINYQETSSDLLTRINIHDAFGAKDIDKWMLKVLPLKKEMAILDVGCGAGKQCFSYLAYLSGKANITGADVSEELLAKAEEENIKLGEKVTFQELDFNKIFPFSDEKFDLASCSFAIYYAEDIPFTIKEMHRVLKTGGYLFTTGPMPENKKMFYEIIQEATGKTIPPMPGSSRYASEILDSIKKQFSSVKVLIFENPLTFPSVEPFLSYTRASLSEDRKLWNTFFQTKEDFEEIMAKIASVSEKWFERDGKLVMTKVVGGFLAIK